MSGYEFTVIIEKDEEGRFVAICPAQRICYTEGESEEEARQPIEDAIKLHVERRIASDELISEEVGSACVSMNNSALEPFGGGRALPSGRLP